MSKHTPLPWSVSPEGYRVFSGMDPSKQEELKQVAFLGYNQATRTEETRANTRLIVRAVNSHADLLSALKAAEAFIERTSGGGETDFRETLRAAITKAES